MTKISLTSYGAVTDDFRTIAYLKNQMSKIKSGGIASHRVDCYHLEKIPGAIVGKLKEIGCTLTKELEVFLPSDNYPPHVDDGGQSYFIPLESGYFYIDGVNYPIVPFVLYGFDDGKLHNTDFCAIMLK